MKFSAAHRIYNPEFSESENLQMFKQCASKNGHGHNYTLEVVVAGQPHPNTGYLIDLKDLKNIIQMEVIDILDHKNLNADVDFFHDIIPTSENLAVFVWQALDGKIPNVKLYKVKISENDTSSVEYYGNPIEIHRFVNNYS